jgi:hypothetical protein
MPRSEALRNLILIYNVEVPRFAYVAKSPKSAFIVSEVSE